jgi:hypothetical protein
MTQNIWSIMVKKYFVFIDVLGFKKLPEIMEKGTGIDVNILRECLLSKVLNKKIDQIVFSNENCDLIKGTDNFMFIVKHNINKLFLLLDELTNIKIPYKKPDFVPLGIDPIPDCMPLEIAVGVVDIKLNVESLINDSNIINELKNDIISTYKNDYIKKNKNEKRVTETFILLTKSMYKDIGEKKEDESDDHFHSNEVQNECIKGSNYYILPLKTIKNEKVYVDSLIQFFESNEPVVVDSNVTVYMKSPNLGLVAGKSFSWMDSRLHTWRQKPEGEGYNAPKYHMTFDINNKNGKPILEPVIEIRPNEKLPDMWFQQDLHDPIPLNKEFKFDVYIHRYNRDFHLFRLWGSGQTKPICSWLIRRR